MTSQLRYMKWSGLLGSFFEIIEILDTPLAPSSPPRYRPPHHPQWVILPPEEGHLRKPQAAAPSGIPLLG